MSHPVISPKKLIEVALPLDAINAASAREKSIRHGHPSTLHLWWARRPLAAARAVIFSQLVHDPEDLWRCQNPGVEPNQQVRGHWTKSRAKLFAIIEELVKWESTTDEAVLEKARTEIRKSWRETCELNNDHPQAAALFDPRNPPGVHDPFAGGGTIPLEAQRLGLRAYATDLNPVAVLINKAMIEIPPKFADRAPVNPNWAGKRAEEKAARVWNGAQGIAEDIRYYSNWIRDKAYERVGELYPTVDITSEIVVDRPDLAAYEGESLTVIAWLWARTVKSPNPAFRDVEVPLASTFILSDKKTSPAYIEPVISGGSYDFEVRIGSPTAAARQGTKLGRGNFRCLMSDVPIDASYIRAEGQAGRLGFRLMAVVLEGKRGRCYLSPRKFDEEIARSATPSWKPEVAFFQQALGFRIGNYGLTKWSDVFTPRQLTMLTTYCDLVGEARQQAYDDAVDCGSDEVSDDDARSAYADAIACYLGLCVSRLANRSAALCFWDTKGENIQQVFARQALTMIFDSVEGNPFSDSTGNFLGQVQYLVAVLEKNVPASGFGLVEQAAAQSQQISAGKIISTDPPYFDNIGYADLSDFFYVWLRRSLQATMPDLFASISTPKSEELVATPHRHGGRSEAEAFFMQGMVQVFGNLTSLCLPGSVLTIFYAFRQSETEATSGTSSNGWETFLQGVLSAGLSVTGTWPVRTEYTSNLKTQRNALASSVVLACRPRVDSAGTISRRQFVRMLNESLPTALDAMTRESEGLHSPVAPVDLSQAIIGPGMAIFSRYEAVLEADGSPMTVKTALQLINRFLAEDDFDADTQFCLRWFEQHGWEAGVFGEADVLARAKGTSVEGVKQAGVIAAAAGSVRLYKWKELEADWDPSKDSRIPIWQVLHQLILAYDTHGESGAAQLYAATVSKAEAARQLAYRLYTLCERRNWAEDARAYNDVVTGWSGIESAAAKMPAAERQGTLFASDEIR